MSAIPQDVQPDTEAAAEDAPKTRQPSPREEAMERMAQSRRDDFAKETGIKIEPDSNMAAAATLDPDADPDDAETEAERTRLEQARDEQGRFTAKVEPEPVRMLKVKIDGEEAEVTEEEVLREYQKGRTADRRLEQVNLARRDLEQREAQLALQMQQQPSAKVAPDAEVALDPAVSKEFTEALFSGDSDKATLAFNKAVSSATRAAVEQAGRGNATHAPVDPAAIAAQVRQQIAVESVLEQSRRDYPQMYADEDIEAIAAAKIGRLQAQGKPFAEALSEVSGELATKFSWPAPGRPKAAAADRTRSEKLARKADLEQPPNGPTVKSTTTEEPVQSASDVIKEMMRARGQTV